jgi:Na+-transporting NADH:ubiquinone oxidoreductase subunit C
MTIVAAFFTTSVAVVHSTTRERVRLNRSVAKRRVVLEALNIDVPPNISLKEFTKLYKKRVHDTNIKIRTQAKHVPVLAARTKTGDLTGYAFRVVGRGFWDTVKGYMAVSPDLNTIQGLAFYEQSETPGLGAEITEPWFKEQFRGKPIPGAPGPDGQLIRLVRAGEEKKSGDVDAITGATQTSKRVERIIDTTLQNFLATMRERTPLNSQNNHSE